MKLDTDLLDINLLTTSNALEIKNQILVEKELELNKTKEIFNIKIEKTKKSIEIEENILNKIESILKYGAISEMEYLEQKVILIKIQRQLMNLIRIK